MAKKEEVVAEFIIVRDEQGVHHVKRSKDLEDVDSIVYLSFIAEVIAHRMGVPMKEFTETLLDLTEAEGAEFDVEEYDEAVN